jgi:hypothetical protein
VDKFPSSVHFFREVVDYLNIYQIMKKLNPYIHSMFKNFTAIAFMQILFIPFSGFYTPCPSNTGCQDAKVLLLMRGNYFPDAEMQ